MSFLRTWIITVVTTTIFMILVDIIMPSNNIKKYTKLVTGLIVIITILSPVFKLFNNSYDIGSLVNKYTEQYNSTSKESKTTTPNSFMDQTVSIFKEKLIKSIEDDIKNDTGKSYLVNKLNIVEDTNSNEFGQISNIVLRENREESTIKPVDKIVIASNKDKKDYFWDAKVATCLEEKYKINSSVIKFVK